MSIRTTICYLEKLFPHRLGLTKEEVDFHTHGLSYAIEPHDGIYLIADVAEIIEQTNGHHKGKQTKSDVIKKYNKILNGVWANSGYSDSEE